LGGILLCQDNEAPLTTLFDTYSPPLALNRPKHYFWQDSHDAAIGAGLHKYSVVMNLGEFCALQESILLRALGNAVKPPYTVTIDGIKRWVFGPHG